LGINSIQPFGPGKVTGDPASFRRFERRSAPGDGPLGGIQHSGMTSLLKLLERKRGAP